MRKSTVLVTILIIVLALSACGQSTNEPARVVEDYLNALVAKDANRISTLSCADWESMALLELDSLQAVEVRLEGVDCSSSKEIDETYSVNCLGKLLATYNNEAQEIDLSVNTYIVDEQGGDLLVCGYR